jgi:hypothetical protein
MEKLRNLISANRYHLISLLILLGLALAVGYPEFQGKELRAHDHTHYVGSAVEAIKFEKETGVKPRWSRSMFGGMPLYLHHFPTEQNLIGPNVQPIVGIGLPRVSRYLWVSMAGFYLMGLAFGMRWYAALFSAASFGLTSYFAVVLTAGHYAKVMAISYMPWVLASFGFVFKRKYVLGGLVGLIMMSCAVMANHLQMIYYYFAFVVSFISLAWVAQQLIQKEFKHLGISFIILSSSLALGTLTNTNRILPIREYQHYSTRGPSELSEAEDPSELTGGLSRTYITGYSFAKGDFMAMFVPNFKGPGNGILGENKEAVKAVKGPNREMLKYFDQYWGFQDASGGVVYVGVLIVGLALLSLILVRGYLVWALAAACLLTMLLALGKRLPDLTDFFIDNFPGYNSLRAVNSIMVIPQFCLPFMAGLLFHRWVSEPEWLGKKFKVASWVPYRLSAPGDFLSRYTNAGISAGFMAIYAGVLGLMYIAPGLFQDFIRPEEAKMIQESVGSQSAGVLEAVETARLALYKPDVLRSLFFVLFAGVMFYMYAFRKGVKLNVFVAVMVGLTAVDMLGVNKRYLNADSFKKKVAIEQFLTPTLADKYILEDSEKGSRVLNLTVSPFNDATTSFFHHSVGGYHGAKMRRYQQFIEGRLQSDLKELIDVLTTQLGKEGVDVFAGFAGLDGLNMLNTRYFIISPDQQPLPNPMAYGALWFADEIKWVENADAEYFAVQRDRNLRKTAVVDMEFKDQLKDFISGRDSLASASITELSPDRIQYRVNASKPGAVIFSEVYYPKGWQAYLNGEPVPHFRANYILRGMMVPAGNHEVVFEFAPEIVKKSEQVSFYASLGSLLMALLLLGYYFGVKRRG